MADHELQRMEPSVTEEHAEFHVRIKATSSACAWAQTSEDLLRSFGLVACMQCKPDGDARMNIGQPYHTPVKHM